MNVQGKRAVVTGGSRGIGTATVMALAERGADVAIIYHSNREKAEKLANKASSHGVKAVAFEADLRVWSRVEELMNRVKKELGGIDILINSAGINGPNSVTEEISVDEWKDVIDSNLSSAFYCVKASLEELRKNKGKIVNMSSIAAKMGGKLGPHYAASKGGLSSMTFALATELAPDITVNAIAPGPVDTELIDEEMKKKLAALTPFGRIATAEEIAHTVIYLLENDYVSGEIIDVNAGRHKD
jgi:3-oxoacyl-[acyl-carrier protein] reductase